MNFIIFMFAEALIMLAFVLSIRKGSLVPLPDIAILYVGFLAFDLYLQVDGFINYEFLSDYSSFAFYDNFYIIELLLAAYAFFLFSAKKKSAVKIDYGEIFAKIELPASVIIISAIVLYGVILAFMLNLDWDIAWRNSEYLLTTNISVMRTNNHFTVALVQSITPMCLLSSGMYFLLLSKGDSKSFIFLPAFLWELAYQIGSHSRVACLMVTIGIMLALFQRKTKQVAILVPLMLILFFQALEGRASGMHGLSQVALMFNLAIDGVGNNLGTALGNMGEGIFSVSEVLVNRPDFPFIYKALSFAPTVNAIDGFGEVLAQFEIRNSAYAPMSTIQEVFSFGIGYALLYFVAQYYAIRRTTALIARNSKIMYIGLNMMAMVGFLLQFAYTTRTSFRFTLYPLLLSFFM